jgi:hypothetical protein
MVSATSRCTTRRISNQNPEYIDNRAAIIVIGCYWMYFPLELYRAPGVPSHGALYLLLNQFLQQMVGGEPRSPNLS